MAKTKSASDIESTGVLAIPYQDTSMEIWDSKYRLKSKHGDAIDVTLDDTFKRVARALADLEEKSVREKWYNEFLWALRHGAIPAGRITSNAGAFEHKPATSTINCTVSGTIEDSMDDILGKVHEAGLTLKAGCGIGYDFSTFVHAVHSCLVQVPTPRALCHSWISTTRCVSPCLLPVVVVARKWAPWISATQT